jgi:hypothetical protein
MSFGLQFACAFAVFMAVGCIGFVGWLLWKGLTGLYDFVRESRSAIVVDSNYSRGQFWVPGTHRTQASGRWQVGRDQKRAAAR